MLRIRALLPVFFAWPVRSSPQVQIGNATLTGASFPAFQLDFFGGIPYAEPPIGHLRFAPPILKATPGLSTIDASQFGAPCSQFFGNVPSDIHAGLPGVSEDCLTINIFRPAGLRADQKVPILFWIYGGGFYQGAASQYNGSAIVAQSVARGTPIIYANINYRLGPLGFPQGAEAQKKGALNLGLKDIITALQWIQINIGAFGGDKNKVTIFGESAGSILIGQLFLDPNFGKLVRAGIFQSGSAASAFLFNATRRESDWQLLTSLVPECAGATPGRTFDCLRAASFATIINATNTAFKDAPEEFPYMPAIDGPGGIIPDLPSKLYAKGQFAHLPFIAGTCLDEGPVFIPPSFNSTEQLRAWLSFNTTPSVVSPAKHNAVIDTLLKLYPDIPALGSPFGTGNETFGLSSQFKRASACIADLAFSSLRRAWAQVASQRGVRVFGYLFSDPQPLNPPFFGVAHGSDNAYVYGATTNGPSATILSHNMIDYWVSFANSLDPNDNHGNTSRPHWGQYTPKSQNIISLNGDDLVMMPDTYRKDQIAFINANPLALRH